MPDVSYSFNQGPMGPYSSLGMGTTHVGYGGTSRRQGGIRYAAGASIVSRYSSLLNPSYYGFHKSSGRRSTVKSKKSPAKYQKGFLRTSGYYRNGNGVTYTKQERKFADNAQPSINTSTFGASHSFIPNIAQGTGESERIGRQITIKTLQLRCIYRNDVTNTNTQTAAGIRILCILDKQANGTEIGPSDVLETTEYLSYLNLVNRHRFTVLMDKYFQLNSMGGAYDGVTSKFVEHEGVFSWYKKTNIPIEYSAMTGGTTERRSNNIVMIAIGNSTHVAYQFKFRVRFVDGG